MNPFVRKVLTHRFGLAALMTALVIATSLITRIALFIKSWSSIDFTFLNVIGIFLVGLFYDLVNASYFIIPLVFYLWLSPGKIFNKNWHRFVLFGIFFFFTFGLLFNIVSEWFFWDEFNTRFNFIAVDYLVYTTEVIGNIRQSYPIEWIVVVLLMIAGTIVYFMRRWILLAMESSIRFRKRSVFALILLALPVIFFFTVNNKIHRFSTNAFVNELSGNGLYELFAAYRNNELDYNQFYQREEDDKAFAFLRSTIQTKESEFVSNDLHSIERKIKNEGTEKKLNVVLISVESFSADFMDSFGNTQHITPFLDSLAQHSLLFTNLYATGTRTVRGLEALSLCVPPTPGQSIVRRPDNENLATLGNVFAGKGYECKYIYGGYSYFDNMGYYFGNNSYEVVDRSRIPDNEIDYENVWGVADENLFTLAGKEIEKTVAKGKTIFAHVMTTSNHRPFTYPEGRIDIPSHTGREGAVKYTDYSIGKFIKESKRKPWFDSTVFIVVADHCASSAGKTELPVNKYHIPMLIYSPANISPAKMERLMSQIDMGPTVLGLLNFSYTSKFYGYDIFKLEPGRERVFISTYQSLGYLKNDTLITLNPQKLVSTSIPNYQDGSAVSVSNNQELIREAIGWYQTASYQFSHGLLKAGEQK